MGFFQDLKEDLSQAVSELVPSESFEEEVVEVEEAAEIFEEPAIDTKALDEEALFAAAEESMGIEHVSDIESMIAASEDMDKEYITPAVEIPAYVEEEALTEPEEFVEEEAEEYVVEDDPEEYVDNDLLVEEPVEEPVYEEPVVETVIEEPVYEEPVAEPVIEEPVTPVVPVMPAVEPVPEPVYNPVVDLSAYEEPVMTNEYISDEVATITKMMTVNGDIISGGSVDVIGAVNGNIEVKGSLNVSGSIKGNASASEIIANNARVDGDLNSTGAIKIGSNTVVRGNVYATSAVIAGAVKGDIDVHGPVILDSSAIVMGDIKSKTVQINIGAAIEGRCSQCYADVSPTNFFKD